MVSKVSIGVGIAALLIIALLSYQVKSLSAQKDELNTQLGRLSLQSGMQSNIISQYSRDNEYMNQVLTERATRSDKQEKALNEQIKMLQADIGDISCTIPQSVTDRLRMDY